MVGGKIVSSCNDLILWFNWWWRNWCFNKRTSLRVCNVCRMYWWLGHSLWGISWFCECKQNYRWKSCCAVLTSLVNFGIVIGNMRAQGYDGAANMSGIHRGVQARISERIPTAPYIHSKAHVLNLAIVHLSSDVSVKPMMAFTFQNSTKNG